MEGFRANRVLSPGVYRLKEVFEGLEDSPAIRGIFGDNGVSSGVLDEVVVEISSSKPRYMRVRSEDGRIMVGRQHLVSADDVTLYLDVVHELTHVKQFWEGRELYDKRFEYVDRPTEVEAFKVAAEEAERLGLGEDIVRDYLKTDWMSDADLDKLIRNIGFDRKMTRRE